MESVEGSRRTEAGSSQQLHLHPRLPGEPVRALASRVRVAGTGALVRGPGDGEASVGYPLQHSQWRTVPDMKDLDGGHITSYEM